MGVFYLLKNGLRSDELAPVSELVARAFDAQAAGRVLEGMRADPDFAFERNRVIELDGRLVARLCLHGRRMRYRGGTLRVGAIGGVCVDPAYRGRGLCRRLLEDATAVLRREGCDLSLLFGKPAIYGPSGWQALIARGLSSTLPVPDDPAVLCRPATLAGDGPALAALHRRFVAPLTGPFERSDDYWRRWIAYKLACHKTWRFWRVERGTETLGYFADRADQPGVVHELAWNRRSPGALQDVLGAIARQAGPVRLFLPFDLPALRAALLRGVGVLTFDDLAGTEHDLRIEARYAGMFKLLRAPLPGPDAPRDTGELLALLRRLSFWLPELDHF